jgi:hypothetical protein
MTTNSEDRLAAQLAAISRWVDEHPPNKARDAEAQLWGRCAKVTEEAGEVIAALIAMTGQNPRKGTHGCVADVLDELLDVAATALAAVEHIDGNRGESVQMLREHVDGLTERAGLAADHQARLAAGTEPHPLGCSCGCDADGFTDGSHAGSPHGTEEG